MPEQKCVNGLDAARLESSIQAIKENPELGKFKLRANSKWVDGHHIFSMMKDFYGLGQEDTSRPYSFTLHADESDVLLGTNYGPNPTETVIHALACCVGSALIINAAAQGIKIDSLEFDMEGDVDARGMLGISDDVRRGLQNVRMNCRISGDAPQSKLQELVQLGQKYSPVFDIVTNSVPVTVMVEGQEVKAAI